MRRVMVGVDGVVVGLYDGQPVQQRPLVALQRGAHVEAAPHQREPQVGERPASGQVLQTEDLEVPAQSRV